MRLLHPLSTECSAPWGWARCQDSWLGELRPAPRSAGRCRPLRRHEVPRGGERGRGRDGRLPPPQPDGHVPGPRHQHYGLEEHEPGKKMELLWVMINSLEWCDMTKRLSLVFVTIMQIKKHADVVLWRSPVTMTVVWCLMATRTLPSLLCYVEISSDLIVNLCSHLWMIYGDYICK